jgi:DNA-binding HxlR family transcriptional regulator
MKKTNSTNFENNQALQAECGLTFAMIMLAGRWKVNILWNIKAGANRYGMLKAAIPGISEKMLTERLKEMEQDGLLIRKDFKTVPPHVEYSFTPEAKDLYPILDDLCDWGAKVFPKMNRLQSKNRK